MKSNRVVAVQEWLANVDMDEFVRDFLELQQETCGPTIDEYLSMPIASSSQISDSAELVVVQPKAFIRSSQFMRNFLSSFRAEMIKKAEISGGCPKSGLELEAVLIMILPKCQNKKSADNEFTTTGCSSGSKYPEAA